MMCWYLRKPRDEAVQRPTNNGGIDEEQGSKRGDDNRNEQKETGRKGKEKEIKKAETNIF